jgi:hypothetical protein
MCAAGSGEGRVPCRSGGPCRAAEGSQTVRAPSYNSATCVASAATWGVSSPPPRFVATHHHLSAGGRHVPALAWGPRDSAVATCRQRCHMGCELSPAEVPTQRVATTAKSVVLPRQGEPIHLRRVDRARVVTSAGVSSPPSAQCPHTRDAQHWLRRWAQWGREGGLPSRRGAGDNSRSDKVHKVRGYPRGKAHAVPGETSRESELSTGRCSQILLIEFN